MPRYKLSPEERAAEKERKENLRNIMKGLDVKNFEGLKDVFKLMVGEVLENGLEGELYDELGYTKYDYRKLGMWVGENESAKFWLSFMNGLKNRGLQDILIACVDGLTGFPAAIEAVYQRQKFNNVLNF